MTLTLKLKKSSIHQSLPDPEEGKQNVLCYCSCSPNSQLLGEWCCCTGCCRATTTMTEMEKYGSTIRFVSRLSIFKIYEWWNLAFDNRWGKIETKNCSQFLPRQVCMKFLFETMCINQGHTGSKHFLLSAYIQSWLGTNVLCAWDQKLINPSEDCLQENFLLSWLETPIPKAVWP